jgi:hypothetical protein
MSAVAFRARLRAWRTWLRERFGGRRSAERRSAEALPPPAKRRRCYLAFRDPDPDNPLLSPFPVPLQPVTRPDQAAPDPHQGPAP